MKYITKIVLSLIILIFSNLGFANECDSTCQLEQIQSYFSALDTISRDGSTIKDIEYLLAITHNDVKYIHVEYEANFNKEFWRAAFKRNLKRGAYKKGPENEIKILNSIYGKNHTAIEYSHGTVKKEGSWQQSKKRLVLFGFTDGKISLVKELW